jgi:hypothetical protein
MFHEVFLVCFIFGGINLDSLYVTCKEPRKEKG